jgi:protein-L-isoaspartate(D-aspartate) O-methyltransferase
MSGDRQDEPPARPPRFPLGLSQVHGPARPSAPAAKAGAAAPGVQRPQRLLHEAARDASRRQAPSGLGLDSDAVRARMVARLRADGIRHEAVLQAFGAVPRHHFVDSALATQAYEDTSLPIGLGQTISKPSVVARMIALLFEGQTASAAGSLGRTLEVGTGCGYQTALLSLLARQVLSIERLKPLHDKARDNLEPWRGGQRIRLVWGDGREGHGPHAPFDSIVAAAGGDDLPPAWLDQLAVGGRLVAPMQDRSTGQQTLLVIDRRPEGLVRQQCETVRFVPLKSGME